MRITLQLNVVQCIYEWAKKSKKKKNSVDTEDFLKIIKLLHFSTCKVWPWEVQRSSTSLMGQHLPRIVLRCSHISHNNFRWLTLVVLVMFLGMLGLECCWVDSLLTLTSFSCHSTCDGGYGSGMWLLHKTVFVDICPIFNIVANKLDTSEWTKIMCPLYIYRSNKVDVGKLWTSVSKVQLLTFDEIDIMIYQNWRSDVHWGQNWSSYRSFNLHVNFSHFFSRETGFLRYFHLCFALVKI